MVTAAMAFTAFGAGHLNADVKPHALFCDNMVLQQGLKAPVWGSAEPGEEVTVSIAGQAVKTTADEKGAWMARLNPLEAGGPHEMTIAGKNAVTIRNVMVGEVWLCSGQSNMGFEVREGMNGPEEIAAADYPNIRLFDVPPRISDEPARDVRAQWRPCSPQSVARFSAAGYFFGRRLHRELNVPIGLICGAQGSSPAEGWTEIEALKAAIDDPVGRWQRQVQDEQALKANWEAELAAWEKAAAAARAENRQPPPDKPERPYVLGRARLAQPAGLWNGTIAPLVPYGIRGVIWYQGESNAPRGREHRKLLPALIRSWREVWGQGDFPFLVVAIAPFGPVYDHPTDSGWAEVVEAQWMTAESVPNSGLAVTTDIGDAKDAHPANKQEVGRRLALIALAKVYGKDVVYSGPMYTSMEVEGSRVRLHFKHVHGGLEAKPEGPLKGFAIAGEDRRFVWADARIEGDAVVVSSDQVARPVAVRYAWAKNPVCNLFNAEGLPAVPFRTDDREQASQQ
jgi:sialate O-acetylesterase